MNKQLRAAKFSGIEFCISLIIGFTCYSLLFPYDFLNPFCDEWVAGNGDFHTHYLGWLAFLQAPLSQWPIFAADAYGEGITKGIIYTDSIPIAALLAKMLGKIFSLESFQYFGLFVLVSFILQHYACSAYLKRLTCNSQLSYILATCFVVFPPLLYRTQGHTALTAQWTIVISLLLFEYRTRITPWIILSCLTLGIHFYLYVMVTLLFTAYVLERRKSLLANRCKSIKYLIVYAILNIAAMFIYGYIPFVASDATFSGYGEFTFNLLSPISTAGGFSRLIPVLPLRYGALEGISYPGLVFAAIIILLLLSSSSRRILFSAITSRHPILLFFLLAAWLFSVSPIVSAGTHSVNFGRLPWPLFIIGDILRASGRLSLPLIYYVLLNATAIYINRLSGLRSRSLGMFAFVGAPLAIGLIYIYDISGFFLGVRANIRSHADSNSLSRGVSSLYSLFEKAGYSFSDRPKQKRIRFYPVQEAPEYWDVFAQHAAENHWKTNGVYLARYDQYQISRQNISTGMELRNMALKQDSVYVLDASSDLADALAMHYPPCMNAAPLNAPASTHCSHMYASKLLLIPPS